MYCVPGKMDRKDPCKFFAVLKFKLKIRNLVKLSLERKRKKEKEKSCAPSNFRIISWCAIFSLILVFLSLLSALLFYGPRSLLEILLENNDLCRRRPYGRARCSWKDDVHGAGRKFPGALWRIPDTATSAPLPDDRSIDFRRNVWRN